MKKLDIVKQFLLSAALTVSTISFAHADSAYKACNNRTNKLTVIYDVRGYPNAFRSNKEKMDAPTKTAEVVVTSAYGESRETSEKNWPGFYDWSVDVVIDGLKQNLSPNEFHAYAMHKCMVRYSD